MAVDLLLDENEHDLVIGEDGDLQFTNGTVDEVAQLICCRLRMFLGEWYLNRLEGVPYFEEVLKKNPNLAQVRALLLSVVVDTPNVEKVLQFDSTFDASTRSYSVRFKAQASDGTVVEGEI